MDVVVLIAISGNGQCTCNEGDAEVIGKRTLQNGLLVLAIYSLRTRSKNISDVLNRELQAIKEKVKYMIIAIEKIVKKTGAFVIIKGARSRNFRQFQGISARIK